MTGEWIKKMRYTYTMEYYSTILHKSNEIVPFTATYLDLEIVILSGVSQKEKDKYHMMSLICGIQMKIFVKEKQTHRHKKTIYGYQRRK